MGVDRRWLIALVATACRVDPSLDGQYRCEDGVTCPSGLVCRASRCVEPEDPRDGAGPTADADPDAPDAPPTPDALILGAFDPPTAVGELNSASAEDDPSLTGDLLEVYFESTRAPSAGGGDIWRATREGVGDPFGTPAIVAELSSASQDGTPEVSPDGLTIFLHSDRAGGLGLDDIWMSTRQARADAWSAPIHLGELSSAQVEGAPGFASDLLLAVLASNRPGGTGDYDLWVSGRGTIADAFGTPTELAEVNSIDVDTEPWLDATGRVLVFTSRRGGGDGLGDLWTATRSDREAAFGAPIRVDGVNTADHDADAWLSPDLRTIYFSRDPGASGGTDIYTATR